MKWYREEKSCLIKAWEASADSKTAADNSFCLSPNKDFMIIACSGDLIDAETGEVHRVEDMATAIREELKKEGFSNLKFEELCKAYRNYVENGIKSCREHFAEVEVVFVQNERGVMDEASLLVRVETPKIPECV